MPHLSQAQVAAAAGVCQATVSLALRGHPRIPEETRRHVVAVAAELGYKRDPLLSAMAALVRTRKASPGSRIAMVAGIPLKNVHGSPFTRRYFKAIKSRAMRLGYGLDEFSLARRGMTPAALVRILQSRGIRGVVFSFFDPGTRIDMDLTGFACASMSYNVVEPRLHHSENDHFQVMLTALDRLRALGYRRIGVFMARFIREFVQDRYRAAIAVRNDPPEFSVFLNEFEEPDHVVAKNFDTVAAWMRSNRLDALLTLSPAWLPAVRRAGFVVPADLAFASLDIPPGVTRLAGICQGYEAAAAAAVDLVEEQLHRGDRGIPEFPKLITLPGVWKDGQTCPPRLRA